MSDSRNSVLGRLLAASLVTLLATGCAFRDDSRSEDAEVVKQDLVLTTPRGEKEVDQITWALYRDPVSLDPITAGDHPEQTVTPLLCDSLFRQEPDGSVAPALATGLEYVDETTAVIRLREGVRFWDGTDMTADDVVYSLNRARNPEAGGYWAPILSRVESVTALDALTVELKLTEPDYWLKNVLSFFTGTVVSKRVAEASGDAYGTVDGDVMCTGPYRLESWKTGEELTIVRNEDYWDDDASAMVRSIQFKGVPDEATLAAGLRTGEIDGAYIDLPMQSLDQVEESGTVNVYRGPSRMIDAFIVSDLDRGVLKDVRVRHALSLAFDRESYIDSLYRGTAQPARALGAPGTWGYETEKFEAAWEGLDAPERDLERARALIDEAGVRGETLTVGMSGEINKVATAANALRSAAEEIGLKVEFESFTADNYISLFIDPEVRGRTDGFFTTNYPGWADPGALYSDFAVPGSVQDYGGYDNTEVAAMLKEARSTEDEGERAEHVIMAQEIITEELPWIPLVAPDTVLVLSHDLSGAPVTTQHFSAPWAMDLGGVD